MFSELQDVLKLAKTCLTESKGIDVATKLLVADQYNIADLKVFQTSYFLEFLLITFHKFKRIKSQEHCLKSFTNATELHKKLQV